jgi:hypothetical protein
MLRTPLGISHPLPLGMGNMCMFCPSFYSKFYKPLLLLCFALAKGRPYVPRMWKTSPTTLIHTSTRCSWFCLRLQQNKRRVLVKKVSKKRYTRGPNWARLWGEKHGGPTNVGSLQPITVAHHPEGEGMACLLLRF